MSFERSYKEQFNITRRIPLHYQRRYLANISNGSFNATFLTGLYKNKIKSLLKNNQLLALALQNDKLKKEELLAESKANADLIMFSKLKLSSMSENLKKVVTALDETLSMLQMHSSEGLKKFTPKNTVNLEEFKEQLRDVLMEPITEEPEPPQSYENISEKVISQEAIIATTEQVIPARDSSVKARVSEKVRTRNTKRKASNELDSEIKKEMFVKNSPLKEIHTRAESKKKNSLLDEVNKKTIVCNEVNQQKNSSSKKANTNSENKVLHLNSEVEKKTFFKKSNLSKSIGISKFKKNKSIKKHEHLGPEIKVEEIEIGNNSHNFTKKAPCKNTKKMKGSENQISSGLISQIADTQNEDILCLNSTNLVLKKSSVDFEISQNNIKTNLSKKLAAIDPKEVNNDVLKVKKLKSCKVLNQHEVKQVQKKPLKCLSSEMNTENLMNGKIRQKPEPPQLDDLTLEMSLKDNDLPIFLNKGKSYKYHLITDTKSLITNNYTKDENIPPLNSSNIDLKTYCNIPELERRLDYHQGEKMVKNLANSTYLVTAEVHKQPNSSQSQKKVNCQITDTIPLQPIVCLTDIFKASKSLCKSISVPPDIGKDRVPLEVQLLKHCSSLKLLTSESLDMQAVNSPIIDSGFSSSVDQGDNRDNCEIIEASSTSDETKKRNFRKRSIQISYKEPATNVKLRR